MGPQVVAVFSKRSETVHRRVGYAACRQVEPPDGLSESVASGWYNSRMSEAPKRNWLQALWTGLTIIAREMWIRWIVEPLVGPPFPPRWPTEKPTNDQDD